MRLFPAMIMLWAVLVLACSSNKGKNVGAPGTAASTAVRIEATAVATAVASASPSATPKPLAVDASEGNCPDGYPVKYSAAGFISVPGDGDKYSAFSAVRCFATFNDAVAAGGKVPTPAPTASPTPNPAATRSRAVLDCANKVTPLVLAERDITTKQILPVDDQVLKGGSLADAQARLGTALSQMRVQDTLVQAVSCDASASDYLALIKGYSSAQVDGTALLGQGVNPLSPTLINQATQRIRDGNALLDQATAIVKTLPTPEPR